MRLTQKGLIITCICRKRMNDTKVTARETVHYCFKLASITKTVLDVSDLLGYILSEGWTIVKCICEFNQSGCRVVFYPKPVAM